MRAVHATMGAVVALAVPGLVVGFVTACKGTLPEPTPDDADAFVPAPLLPDTSRPVSAVTACEKLHELQCDEGADAGGCAQTIAHANATQGFRPFDLWCLSTASSKAQARSCGMTCP